MMATATDPRHERRKSQTTPATSRAPSMRFVRTVWRVRWTKVVRSMNGTILTPVGRMPLFRRSTRWRTCSSTIDGFSPRRINTNPSTASRLTPRPTAPCRGVLASTSVATSLMRTGVPFSAVSTISLMSSGERSSPSPRTMYCSCPWRMCPAPMLALDRERASYTVVSVMPCALSRSGPTRMWISFRNPPCATISATPGTCLRNGTIVQSRSVRSSVGDFPPPSTVN